MKFIFAVVDVSLDQGHVTAWKVVFTGYPGFK